MLFGEAPEPAVGPDRRAGGWPAAAISRLPNYDEPGHKTLGNWYTTILNAYGNPIKHYGDFDVSLKVDQEGAISQFLS